MTTAPIYITRPLLTVLLEIAGDAAPNSTNVYLVNSAAGDLEPLSALDRDRSAEGQSARSVPLQDLAPDTPVFSDFYFPDVGNSLDFVFGVDLGTPAGQGRARFVSHPDGRLQATREDTFAAALVVAVPPWEAESVAAFDRNDRRLDLDVIDAEPPPERLVGE